MPHEPGTTFKRLVKRGASANDCWMWLGRKNAQGYGSKQWHGKPVLARRWLWELLEGPIKTGMVLAASCKVNGCVNPAHMRPIYPVELAIDTKEALSLAEVKEVLAVIGKYPRFNKARVRQAEELAEYYGTTVAQIRQIWAGERQTVRRGHKVAGRNPTVSPQQPEDFDGH